MNRVLEYNYFPNTFVSICDTCENNGDCPVYNKTPVIDLPKISKCKGYKMNAEQLKNELSKHYGTKQYFRMFPKLIYTEGVKDFAEKAGGYWLLTDIALFLMDKKLRSEYFLSIKLSVKDRAAVLTFDDGNGEMLLKKDYKYTDCPEGEWEMFYTSDVLMLPSEY